MLSEITTQEAEHGFFERADEDSTTGGLVPAGGHRADPRAGNPITQPQELPFGVDHLIGFNELLTCKHPESAGVHFFLDDYQFERFWRQPQRYLAALAKCPLVIGPDFSLYTDFPAPL